MSEPEMAPRVSPFWARKVGRALVGVGVALLLLGAVWTAVQTTITVQLMRETQLQNTERDKQIEQNTATIERLARDTESCATPAGLCFQRQQQRVIYAAACATQGHDTARSIRLCVEELLARRSPP